MTNEINEQAALISPVHFYCTGPFFNNRLNKCKNGKRDYMYCDKCGTKIADDSTFCKKCGKSMVMEEASEEKVSLNSRFGTFNVFLFVLIMAMSGVLIFQGGQIITHINEEKKFDDIASSGDSEYTVVMPRADYQDDNLIYVQQEEYDIIHELDEESSCFRVLDEMYDADFSSGKVQIGNNIYYLGDPLSYWISGDVYITDNTTGYPGATALAYDGKPVARVYLRDNGGILLEDCTVRGIFFGIQYNADVTQNNANRHLADPEPIVLPGGLYVGRDFSEIQDKYGDYLDEDAYKAEIKIFRFTKDYPDSFDGSKPTLYVDRITGKVCGLYWEIK